MEELIKIAFVLLLLIIMLGLIVFLIIKLIASIKRIEFLDNWSKQINEK